MYQYETETPNPFSVFFSSVPNHHSYDESEMYSFASSSSVDCTLSLGTPSTRLTNTTTTDSDYDRRSSGSCTSNFCWDNLLLQQQYYSQHGTNSSPPEAAAPAQKASNRGGCISNSGRESLLARRCANCDTTSTPLWRNGPRGPKSLCNACGIRYKKEERRATASVAVAGASNLWAQQQHSQEMPYYSPATEFAFDDGGYSWRLDVSERPNYVHDFTRYS